MRLPVALMLLAAMSGTARANGNDLFNSNCLICHQANARGVPGMYPPLADSIGSDVTIPEGRAYLVHVVSFGMTGAISVHGQTYNGVMQPWSKFKDEDIAEVLNYILTTFNAKLLTKDFSALTSDEVQRYRTADTGMGDVRREREALLQSLAAHQGGGS